MVNVNSVPNLSLIVAVADNLAIGRDNNLLWHISDDLKRFKSITSGHPIIMGRHTFESFPKGPLPNRRNIIFSHNPDYHPQGAEVVHSIRELFNAIAGEEQSFVIGGAAIYNLLLPFVSEMRVTRVFQAFEADTFFPVIDNSIFQKVSESEVFTDQKNGLRYSFVDFVRRPSHPITFPNNL